MGVGVNGVGGTQWAVTVEQKSWQNYAKKLNHIRFDRPVMTYKILSKFRPESLWDKYQYRSAYSHYETKNCKDLQIPRIITVHAKKDFTTLP